MKSITIAVASIISITSYIETQAAECAVTSPLCGEDSKLCPHNMCTKPDGGKCNNQGDGCVYIRWNRDGCLAPENTCGSGYCGTPPDFSDCYCDNGLCIAIGEQSTPAVTNPPTKGPTTLTGIFEPSPSDGGASTEIIESTASGNGETFDNAAESSNGENGGASNEIIQSSDSENAEISMVATEVPNTDNGGVYTEGTESESSDNDDLGVFAESNELPADSGTMTMISSVIGACGIVISLMLC